MLNITKHENYRNSNNSSSCNDHDDSTVANSVKAECDLNKKTNFLRNIFLNKNRDEKKLNSALSTNTIETRASIMSSKSQNNLQTLVTTTNRSIHSSSGGGGGYLNDFTLNQSTLHPLNFNTITNNSSSLSSHNQNQTIMTNELMDFGNWCNLLDWKIEFNTLTNVLDDLAKLK